MIAIPHTTKGAASRVGRAGKRYPSSNPSSRAGISSKAKRSTVAPFGGNLAWLPQQDARSTAEIQGFGSDFCPSWL